MRSEFFFTSAVSQARYFSKKIDRAQVRHECEIQTAFDGGGVKAKGQTFRGTSEPWVVGRHGPREPFHVLCRARVAEVQVFRKMSGALHLHGGTADQDELDIRVKQGTNRLFKFHFFDR